ncbi:sterigmatocystin biosynthesis monooxygenase [Penicillium sp. IBT 35674x]|nr:sterigmatocystin biosynthesis monooxygenase [Penicillium sp. IBT 35674x]
MAIQHDGKSQGYPDLPPVAVKPIESTEAYRTKCPVAYELSKLPFNHPRRLKVIVVGAGISGLSLAHAVETQQLKNVELVILEKNAGIGGTWYENRYPGCACDIPAHNYQFTWAPNPKTSSFYITAPEILEYLEDVADKFHLTKYIHTHRKVTGSRWLADKQVWQVTSKRTDGRRTVVSTANGTMEGEVGEDIVEECDVFINASGFFNNWRWPDVPGREEFRGVMAHSANYNPDVSLRGKRVAVIGNGSSGIQVTAAVQKVASHMSVYLRNPTWVTGNMASRFIPAGQTNFVYDQEQKKKWASNPKEYLQYRKEVEKELNIRFPLFIRDTAAQAGARDFTQKAMKSKLEQRPDLIERMLPTYAVGCRRPTPGAGYLEALCENNTEVVWGQLDRFTEKGIRSADGTEREFDVIIAATGFDMSFVPRWPIIGDKGVNLQEEWEKNPACYLSALAQDMPNYFVYLGPGSPVGHGSLITSIERITLYITDMITKLQRENYSSFQLKPRKALAYQSQMLNWLDKTVWGDNCQSSFKNGTVTGGLHAFHPGSRLHYFELLRRHRYEDFDWTSRCTEPDLEYAWLNNGFLSHELNPVEGEEVDPTWYLNQEDDILSQFVNAEAF